MSMRGAMISRTVVSSISMMLRIISRSSGSISSPSVSISARRRISSVSSSGSSALIWTTDARAWLMAAAMGPKMAAKRRMNGDEPHAPALGVAGDDEARQRIEHGDGDERDARRRTASTPQVWPRSRVTTKMPKRRGDDDGEVAHDGERAERRGAAVDVAQQRVGAAVALAGEGAQAQAARRGDRCLGGGGDDEQRERCREDDEAEGRCLYPGSASSFVRRRPSRGCARARRWPSCRRARRA